MEIIDIFVQFRNVKVEKVFFFVVKKKDSSKNGKFRNQFKINRLLKLKGAKIASVLNLCTLNGIQGFQMRS